MIIFEKRSLKAYATSWWLHHYGREIAPPVKSFVLAEKESLSHASFAAVAPETWVHGGSGLPLME